jgi:dienelactone hydrolase
VSRAFARSALAGLAALLVLTVTVPLGAAEAEPEPGTPAWGERELGNSADAHSRLVDQYTNPTVPGGFAQQAPAATARNGQWQAEHPDRPRGTLVQVLPGGEVADPHRNVEAWASTRGRVTEIEFTNRNGARLLGRIWRPLASHARAPYPAVVIAPGSAQAHEGFYHWAAQGLAEAGYLVLTFDTQGQGRSETFGHRPDGAFWCGGPEPEAAAWERDYAEEQGDCPGVPFQQDANFLRGTVDALDFLLSAPSRPHRWHAAFAPSSDGAMAYNPHWQEVDDRRIGLAGHSLGANAISRISAHHPRVHAIAAWDNLQPVERPRVPALGVSPDYGLMVEPKQDAPDRDEKAAGFLAWQAAGVDVMTITPRASTHLDFSFIPLLPLSGSRWGERVAMHYTLAWFDRYLKDDRRALARLTAHTFDGSADASATGTGSYSPPGENEPHRLEGQAVAERLSFHYRSAYWLDRGAASCEDMRTSRCPVHDGRAAAVQSAQARAAALPATGPGVSALAGLAAVVAGAGLRRAGRRKEHAS